MVFAQRSQSPSALTVLFALMAFAALFQASIFSMVDPSLLGWRPDHGHVFAGGVPQPHAHPWDHHYDAAGHGLAEDGRAVTPGVLFTPGDSSAPGSVATAMLAPAAASLLQTFPPAALVEAARIAVPDDPPALVPSPPPQG